ncbi:patched domain-containing protein 3-like [Centruroides sculpturatus]|uniref:patched domain-containing protein 3-like n=1 Tax=Centruroides sculpturatus TaxID=218467 RepID=UPI000C6E27F1|nr:patched domain-containing protein 3-like [Centruroides sculpturatus]XP_023225667.1 patched domain-containing protein 3-like [Centruroides sculpturatus]XP_023225670.1 patched domain-containing protein 3-like [Centruroides sculpturatus]XP_023225671.1 patched domain-containing protein 3-like [Centruroides sculpturatus]
MKLDCLRRCLSFVFRKLGRIIGQHPYYFIIIPVLLSTSLSVFINKLKSSKSMDELLTANEGKFYNTMKFVKKTFYFNTSEFVDQMRLVRIPKSVYVLFLKKGGGNMLEKDILLELKLADEIIKNTTIRYENQEIGYSEICGIVNGKCYENPILKLNIDDIVTKRKRFKYPVEMDPVTYSYEIYCLNVGGVTVDKNDFVERAEALGLMYFADYSSEEKIQWIEEWKLAAYKKIQNYHFKHIKSYSHYFWESENYVKVLFETTKPMIGGVMGFVSVFAVITCMSNSWIRSKPMLGVASVISAGLAIASSFGLMAAFGMDYSYWNTTIPFLVIVTEIDDAFVLIACWRITNPQDKVHKRMEDAFSEAGVSITLTSITNILSYCIGLLTAFPLIRLFCIYSATCIFFTFLYQVTFFGGCMALSGYNEEKSLQNLKFTASLENTSTLHESLKEEPIMKFFRDKLGTFISNPISKMIIITLYFLNLSFGIWGAYSIRNGLDLKILYQEDSPITHTTLTLYKYFTHHPFAFQIIINKTLDYSNTKVQESVEALLRKFESHPHVADTRFTASWLKYYKDFQSHPIAKYSLSGYNMSVKQDFIDGLRYVFFRFKAAEHFSNDVIFTDDGSEISCSRFFVLAKDIAGRENEIKILKELWEIAEDSPFPVLVHCMLSDMIEQGVIIARTVYELFWITAILIIFLFLLFVPKGICAFLVSISVISTMIETLGYMSFWGVNLDVVSAMSLILCVGFCLNYPAHISYAYVTSTCKSPNEKLKDSLYRIGFPILQGSLSTILGIFFIFKQEYGFFTFVKIVCLISMETAFHALLFIPVIHSLISSCCIKKKPTKLVPEEFDLLSNKNEST